MSSVFVAKGMVMPGERQRNDTSSDSLAMEQDLHAPHYVESQAACCPRHLCISCYL